MRRFSVVPKPKPKIDAYDPDHVPLYEISPWPLALFLCVKLWALIEMVVWVAVWRWS